MFIPKYGYNARTGWRTPPQPTQELDPNLFPPNIATAGDTLGTTEGFIISTKTTLPQRVTSDKHSGTGCIYYNPQEKWSRMDLTAPSLTTLPPGNYEYSFWYKLDEVTMRMYVTPHDYSWIGVAPYLSPVTEWTEIVIPFTLPVGKTGLSFRFQHDNDLPINFYVDDLKLIEVI